MKALALRAHKKGLELACHIAPGVPEAVVGDPGRLRQVVVNLVGNAIKFTERGEVVVDVAVESRTDYEARLHVTVIDTGTGIPKERQGVIFEAFAQANSSTTREFGGTGLGLTISSKLVAMMGGRIWVESEPGKGSKFHFTARLGISGDGGRTRARRPGAGGPPRPPRAGRRRQRHQPPHPRRAADEVAHEADRRRGRRPRPLRGDEGARRQPGHPFALVLSDALMPEMDGFELVERLNQSPELAKATIMMLSSADQAKDMARCRASGISSYLVKPIKQSELLDAIVTLLNSAAAREKAESASPRRFAAATQGRARHA